MTDYKNKPWTLRDHDRSASGYVIRTGTDGKPEILARIDVVRPVDGAGRLRVALLDCGHPDGSKWHYGTANGYGYDKLTAALEDMTVAGESLGNHSDHKGRPTIDVLCQQKGWLYLAP